MRKLLFLLSALLCSIIASAAVTDVTTYDDIIYAESLTAAPGSRAVLSIKMKNSFPVPGFQFDLKLPDGITVAQEDGMYLADLSTERTTAVKTNYFDSAIQADGSFRVLCNTSKQDPSTGALYVFSGNDGEVCTITLDIAEDMVCDDYELVIKGIELSDLGGTAHRPGIDIVSLITVSDEEPEYEEGYDVKVVPFLYEEEVEVPFLLTNVEKLTNVEFDVTLPDVVVGNELYYVDAVLAKTKFTTSITEEGNRIHVSVARRSTNTIASGEDTEIATLGLILDDVVEEGVYTLNIRNIIMTDINGETHEAKPYAADIYVGTPEAEVVNGTVKFSGDYSDEDACSMLLASMPSDDASITVVDLRGVTGLSEQTTIVSANPNTVILTSSDLDLANEKNVVIGKECANLEVTDSYAFATSKAFIAAQATYQRNLSSQWGTIMLPYAVESNEAVTYYQLANVDMVNGVLSFEQVESVEANVPAVFRTNVTKLEANGENVSIPVCGGNAEGTTVSRMTLVGSLSGKTYENLDPAAAEGVYFIRSNKFWRGEGDVVVPPFRACFESESVPAMSFALSDGTETDVREVKAAEGVEEIYDLNGIYMGTDATTLPAGFYVVGGKKVIIKK